MKQVLDAVTSMPIISYEEEKKDKYTSIMTNLLTYQKKVKGLQLAYNCIKENFSQSDADNIFGEELRHTKSMLIRYTNLCKKQGYHIKLEN